MGGERGEDERGHGEETCPKSRSGWDMKSVMRSSMLRGSSTNVGNVTLCRSMPTLARHDSHQPRHSEVMRGGWEGGGDRVNGRTSAER